MTTPELQNTEQQALALFQKIDTLIQHAKKHLKTAVDLAMVYTYFEIGREIVEDEQKGQLRAEYGTYLLENVAQKLTAKYKRGYSADNLKLMRRFYVVYAQDTIRETLFPQLENYPRTSNGLRFFLSWSHYIKLMRIDNIEERHFYEIESMQNHWALSELKRQFDSSLYERLALSSNKEKVKQLALVGQQIETAADLVKDPLVIEFLGLDEQTNYLESDLEKRIIDNLQKFMLELGKGFTFVGRQVRFTFQEAHFRCDLVFYNRLLRCFVLFDLKIGEIKHQDIGQMQMYVNFYDRQVKLPDENKTIGIILCKDKNDAVVEMTLPENNDQIFASKYQTILPSKEELKKLMANNSQ